MTAPAKRFQEETAKAATAALKGANPLRRFLVADEVGLGKTVVARDTLAALAKDARKFVVYYVTSGLKVADQNKGELLRFLDKADATAALSSIDRLGLVPFEARARGRLRLYAFTPKTSFSGAQRLYGGKAIERAFVGELLEALYPGFRARLPEGYLEQGATTGWPWACEQAAHQIDHVPRAFIAAYGRALRAEFGTPARAAILGAIATTRPGQSLGRMRRALAQAALEATPPDLIIFDEFQCYRDLLTAGPDNPLGQRLISGVNDRPPPPILLLSATPYRFYAERWEVTAGVQPHVELFDLVDFLGGPGVRQEAETLFRRFGDLLHQIGRLDPDARETPVAEAHHLKATLEGLLRPLMSRTERPVPQQPVGSRGRPPQLQPEDLDVYRHFVTHAKPKMTGSAIAYWMSVPLPAQALGDRYQISRQIHFPAARKGAWLGATTCFQPPRAGWGSAKLRALNTIAPPETLALPWALPSLPWWSPSGPWAKAPRSPKILLFSRFRATPQSVAGLTSLEVERRHVANPGTPYGEAWKKRHLNPKPNQGTTLALFYPSPFLITAVDPLDVRSKATIKQIRRRVRHQIIAALPASIAPAAPNARADRRRRSTWSVLAAIERAQTGRAAEAFKSAERGWSRIAAKDVTLQGLLRLRREAEPIDWVSSGELDTLVDMALGAPGVVVGRALARHLPSLFESSGDPYRRLAGFCWTRLRSYLDRPVFWSVLQGEDATEKYQRACIDGGLEAVLDEHFWLRKSKVSPDGLIDDLGAALAANIGTFAFKGARKDDRIRIRCHAAVPFGGSERETQPQAQASGEPPPARWEEIRSAFNTPFWPNILATTSAGQEGLDFHSWCDQLGHWDLCSSPVDLEQREGRVQRFAGLTVRRALADALGDRALSEARRQGVSPWDVLARDAETTYGDDSGLSPWWTMPGTEVKRHLFALPQSRDLDRFERLRNQRLLYRLALGQPDQEDLVDLLASRDVARGETLRALALDLSAFSHRHAPAPASPSLPTETPR